MNKKTVLVIGSTGQTGRLVVDKLQQHSGSVDVRLSSRRPSQVEDWKKSGRNAVLLELMKDGARLLQKIYDKALVVEQPDEFVFTELSHALKHSENSKHKTVVIVA